MNIYAVQAFLDEGWRTRYLTTFGPEASEAYEEAERQFSDPVRLVTFTVANFDFVATHCDNFKINEYRA